jgi:uncharacterized protein
MKIDLRSLKEENAYLEFKESPDSLELEAEGMEFSSPVELKLRILKSGKNYIGEGEVKTEVGFECSRCLNKYTQAVKSEIRFLLKEEKEQIILESEEGGDQIQKGSFFNLDDLVRENLVLSLPLKPLCFVDCKGLCPVCGVNLNLSTCECKREVIDPRWEKLKKLKLENKSKKQGSKKDKANNYSL